jgi:hypothetical protein
MLQLSPDFGVIVFRELDKQRRAFYVQINGEMIPAMLCKCRILTGQKEAGPTPTEYSFECPIDLHATRARDHARESRD